MWTPPKGRGEKKIGVAHAPPCDRRYRQRLSLARSGARGARASRSRHADVEERSRRRHPGGGPRCRRSARHLRQAAWRSAAPAHTLQGDRPVRPRRRQYRHRDGGRAWHHRHLRARLLHAGGVGPRHGAAARARPQGGVLEHTRAIGPLGDAGGGAAASPAGPDAGPDRLRPYSARACAESAGIRPQGHGARSLCRAGRVRLARRRRREPR